MDTNRCRVLTKHLLRALPSFMDKLEACDCEIDEVNVFFQPDVYKEEYVTFTCKAEDLLSNYDAILDKAHLPKVDRIYATMPIVLDDNRDVVVVVIEGDNTHTDVNIYTEQRTELFISPEDLNRKLKCRFLGGAPTELVAYEGHISYIPECIHPKCFRKLDAVKDLRR